MSDLPGAPRPPAAGDGTRWQVAAVVVAITGVLLLAVAAFVVSYAGIRQIAVAAGVSAALAGLYPARPTGDLGDAVLLDHPDISSGSAQRRADPGTGDLVIRQRVAAGWSGCWRGRGGGRRAAGGRLITADQPGALSPYLRARISRSGARAVGELARQPGAFSPVLKEAGFTARVLAA